LTAPPEEAQEGGPGGHPPQAGKRPGQAVPAGGPPTGLFLDPTTSIYTLLLSLIAIYVIALLRSHMRKSRKTGLPQA